MRFELFGRPVSFYRLIYPLLVGAPPALDDRAACYALLHWLQPLVMSLVAIPSYLWARSLVERRRFAPLAALLAVALPALAYSGLASSPDRRRLPTTSTSVTSAAGSTVKPAARSRTSTAVTTTGRRSGKTCSGSGTSTG
jgi:hypothetical protein